MKEEPPTSVSISTNNADPARGADHAVVIGGSVAGSLAARALSGSFEHVTVFDRDTLPAQPIVRRGVPQSRQVHALLARGAGGLDGLFPGFLDEMTAAGAPSADGQAGFSWYLDGHRMASAVSGLRNYGATRPLIETLIRGRVKALPNVTFVDHAEVTGLLAEDGRVSGARVLRQTGGEQRVPAALVVDAAGRGSRSRIWLGELGYPVPEQTVVTTNVTYVTRHYEPDSGLLEETPLGALVAPFPGHPRGGAVIRQQNGQFAVLLSGMLGEDVPTDDAGMLDFAKSLSGQEVAEVLQVAVPADSAVKMRFPESSLTHFDKLTRRLEGLLVVGDALSTFNPVYGQGITVAVMEAELLQTLCAAGGSDISERYFAAAAGLLTEPWALATGSDLRFPEVEGERDAQDAEIGRYLDQFRVSTGVDPVLGTAFLHVMNLMAPLASLLAPDLRERTQAAR